MPNFSTNPLAVSMPVWMVNPTETPCTWRYNGEYFTFEPKKITPMDMIIGAYWQKHLPQLVMCRSEDEALALVQEQTPLPQVAESTEEEDEENEGFDVTKPLEEMSYKELQKVAKTKGIKSFGMKHDALLFAL